MKSRFLAVIALACFLGFADSARAADSYDVVVYGGTSGGVAASIQAARMGKSVVLIEPGQHLGGLTSGGLGATDIGNKQAIGGISREFYQRLGEHYGQAEAWTFEPHVAEDTFRAMIAEAGVPVWYGERIDLSKGVEKEGSRIASLTMESGLRIEGKVFIDATYEGDLMAKSGVSYHVGRESSATYGEPLNGVATRMAKYHQFEAPVDPYVIVGDPESGLLPGIQSGGPGEEGAGDHRVQAYNFRMCLTNDPANRLPFPKPAAYDPLRYELLLRYLNAGHWTVMNLSKAMPNAKTDTNNKGAFATDNIGMNYDYPDGDYATRDRIFEEHKTYQQGLMWFLVNDPRVPAPVREEMRQWGLPEDEFTESGGWPHQLYVREARRMISDYVMTQQNCQGERVAEDAVGLAAYTMDSHHVQRYVDESGHARNEGDVEVGGFPPYTIAYRSIRPRREECGNLLVPVCLSASHIAYGSIRMEPVFMVLGQSAATAACMAVEEQAEVQDVDIDRLTETLRRDGQVLAWESEAASAPISNPFFAFDNGVGRGEWTPEQQAKTLARLGYDGIGYTGGENLDERLAAFEKHGLKIFNLYIGCNLDTDPPYGEELTGAIERLKGTGVTIWLTVQGKAEDDAKPVRVVGEIADLAAASGLKVAIYPHSGFYVDTLDDALRVVRQVKRENLGVTFNLCHELMAGNGDRIEALLDEAAPYLYLVSINGANRGGTTWAQLIQRLGDGTFDVLRVMKKLQSLRYSGPIGLQCYQVPGDTLENLKHNIGQWWAIRANLN